MGFARRGGFFESFFTCEMCGILPIGKRISLAAHRLLAFRRNGDDSMVRVSEIDWRTKRIPPRSGPDVYPAVSVATQHREYKW